MVIFGNRRVGDGEHCFITFEAGPTHNGLESAKRLVTLTAKAGADAIKFQILDPDRLVADKKQLFSYEILFDRETGDTLTVSEPLYDILCRRTLDPEEWKDLKAHSDSMGLAFFATVGFEDEIELLEELECDSIKMDTGNATIGEIEEAVDIIVSEGNENIIIHNCPSGYPARLESINLNLILTLKHIFRYPVAFSDHTPGWEMDIAAVAVGANLVEKTITEDRTIRSVEHIMSLEPQEMKDFITKIREVEIAMGNGKRILHSAELEKRKAIRRSAFLTKQVAKGQTVREAEIEFRRPGFGIPPNEFEKHMSRNFARDLAAGHMVEILDFG
jgi:sialic acid synthase SpsE